MNQDVYNNTDVQYDSYLEPEVDPFIQQILASTAITSINGITGPTVTFAGGTSGFSFAPGGTTITLVSPLTVKGDLYTHSSTVGIALAVGTNGFVLSANSGTATGLEWIANAVGTVTSVSVVSANGFAGTVATATTTPAITLTTTITGVLKGNGTAISAAASADIISTLGYTPTDAAVVPSTAPTAGQILVGNAGNTAYLKQTVSGSGATITLASTGVITISAIANASLTNSSVTINGTSVSLGGTRTLTLASADFVNQGTTTTVLHGNAAGNPSFSQIVNADITNATIDLTAKVTGVLPVANGGVDQTAWTGYTPTLSPDGGTISSSTISCFYQQQGKTVRVRGSIALNTVSGGSGGLNISLPVTARDSGFAFAGTETNATANSLSIYGASTTAMRVWFYNTTTVLSSGKTITFAGTYEAS